MVNQKKLLIVGANGQLGTALRERYPEAMAVDSSELDITSSAAVMDFGWSAFATVINAAAYTNVDCAETVEGRVAAWKVNATGARNLAAAAIAHDLTLVHISSDYVFDGSADNHSETEAFSPLSVYGQSKAAGDLAVSLVPKHYNLRTTWVIGEGKNFVRIMLGLGERDIAPTVVADQIGRLTFTDELVNVIDHLLTDVPEYGTYNVTNDGEPASWADITRQIFELSGYELLVTDTTTADYYAGKSGIAPRPLNSVMDLSKLKATGYTPGNWQEALAAYVTKEHA